MSAITYEERARREEQQKRDMWERPGGKSAGLLSATAKAASTGVCRSNGICVDLGGVDKIEGAAS
jgi:hypothetical protein